jgi:predicted  nucleic acid-binding Zn-ribbon protein
MLESLIHLQSIERQLTHVRGRLKTRKNAVAAQERRIEQIKAEYNALHDKSITRRKDADRFELDLRAKEEQVAKLRTALNLAKTNKEYAAILTQLNTYKADNAKVEEEVLKIMQDVDVVKAQTEKISVQVEAEQKRLAEITQASGQEIDKLTAMLNELTAQRTAAAQSVPAEALTTFESIAKRNDGDVMAIIEVNGRKPPFDYSCGGCYMSLNAEHANALRSRDEIRNCDNCGRILYMDAKSQNAPT